MDNLKLESQALHTGHDVSKTQGTRAVPIYQSSSYVFQNSDHAARLFGLEEAGWIYTRLHNPTCDVLEQRLAAMEGGLAACVTASGASALMTTFLTLLNAGDHIVSAKGLYGGTYTQLSVLLPRFGITTTFVGTLDVAAYEAAIQDNTRAIFVESLANPSLDIPDLEAIAAIAKKHGIPLIVDNTVPSPALLNPIAWGANIVIHSLTKYIGGHGTTLGGVIVDAGKFDWSSGKFPAFTEPSPGYHGMVYHNAFKEAAFIAKVRLEGLRDIGAALSPLAAFELIQGLETLTLRMAKHSENALALAKHLSTHPKIDWVSYPGLAGNKSFTAAQKYLTKGQSGIVTIGIKGGFEAAKTVADNVKLFSLLANIGDTRSLIIHPASTTHSQLSADELTAAGVGQEMVRLSVGIEHLDDIISDLEQALALVII
ncbi:MAG: hypothetical protein RIS47_470 [Bacteroidota bacterium]|jgi:O-acetylhomoserine (thiol)-lyase